MKNHVKISELVTRENLVMKYIRVINSEKFISFKYSELNRQGKHEKICIVKIIWMLVKSQVFYFVKNTNFLEISDIFLSVNLINSFMAGAVII